MAPTDNPEAMEMAKLTLENICCQAHRNGLSYQRIVWIILQIGQDLALKMEADLYLRMNKP